LNDKPAPHDRFLERVDGGCGGVGPSGWDAPYQEAWFRLLKAPALGLFGAMMPTA
jgi:hypothetical protein